MCVCVRVLCLTRALHIVCVACSRQLPTITALHLSGAGAPGKLDTRKRTGQSEVRFLTPVMCVARCVCPLCALDHKGLLKTSSCIGGNPVMSYKYVSGSSVDCVSFGFQRQGRIPFGYYTWAKPAGHVIRQSLRSLCPTKTTPQMHSHMVTVWMCVRVLVCICKYTRLCMHVCLFVRMLECTHMCGITMANAGSTLTCSRAIPHPSTNQALRYLCALLYFCMDTSHTRALP